ncbi:MAG: hypothetical protein KJ070_13940 [Verrucomicrobia bacterium]|nr:hypothetical protein [Verrucomicrobiota bacterium]
MSKLSFSPSQSTGDVWRKPTSAVPRWLGGLLALVLLTASSLQASLEDPDLQFIKIMSVIDQADSLKTNGNDPAARTKYQEAHRLLQNFRKNHPVWNPKVVAFRLKYVADRIEALSKPPPVAEGTEAAAAEGKAGSSAALPAGVQVKLLEAGAEPRRPLRLQAKPGDQQSLNMTMKLAMDMELAGMPPQSVKMPAIKLDLAVAVKEVAANGDITFETTLGKASLAEDADALPQMADAIKASFDSLEGLAGTGTISPRGLGRNAELKMPVGSDPQTRQAMQQMNDAFSTFAVGFPDEPVGPGARWEVKLPLKSQGMTITQTATYHLAAVEGDTLTIKSTVTQQAANQKITNPAMPNLKMDLVKMTGSGTGTSTINLAQLFPSRASMDTKSEADMAMSLGAQKQTMSMKMDLKLQLDSK